LTEKPLNLLRTLACYSFKLPFQIDLPYLLKPFGYKKIQISKMHELLKHSVHNYPYIQFQPIYMVSKLRSKLKSAKLGSVVNINFTALRYLGEKKTGQIFPWFS